jgi:hypothetical protein
MATYFGIHYVEGLLQSSGWPRRKSFFNSTAVIDSTILDVTINQMIDWAAGIGACRPKLALQIFATMFSKADWDKVGLLDVINIADARKAWNRSGNNNPRKIVNPMPFAEFEKSTKASLLKDKTSLFESYFLESLFWGLNNPDKFINYFNSEREENINNLELYKKAELGVNSIPTLEDMLNEAELIISAYEKKMNTRLSPIPKRLMDDAQSLGVKFDIYSPETKLGAQKKAGLNLQQVEEVVTEELNENLLKLPDAESKKMHRTTSLDSETKKCPFCAETIKLEAIKCRFCNTNFDPLVVAEDIEFRQKQLDAKTSPIEFFRNKFLKKERWTNKLPLPQQENKVVQFDPKYYNWIIISLIGSLILILINFMPYIVARPEHKFVILSMFFHQIMACLISGSLWGLIASRIARLGDRKNVFLKVFAIMFFLPNIILFFHSR